jgi:hypothetical protein
LTFFDDDVIEFFSPHAKGKSAIFLLAIGKRCNASHSSALETGSGRMVGVLE